MPTRNKKRFVVYLEQSQIELVETEAIKKGTSRSSIIREILENKINVNNST